MRARKFFGLRTRPDSDIVLGSYFQERHVLKHRIMLLPTKLNLPKVDHRKAKMNWRMLRPTDVHPRPTTLQNMR
jgi:hypothetical protein